MLPDIRAVIAAMMAAIGLLMIAFALVATYRVAQQHQAGSLQEDLVKRGRAALPAQSGERPVLIIETAGSASRRTGRDGKADRDRAADRNRQRAAGR